MKLPHIILFSLIFINIIVFITQFSRIYHVLHRVPESDDLLHATHDTEGLDGMGNAGIGTEMEKSRDGADITDNYALRSAHGDIHLNSAANDASSLEAKRTAQHIPQLHNNLLTQSSALAHLPSTCHYASLMHYMALTHQQPPQPRTSPIKIYDGFTFNNEFEILEMRLRELNDLVDYFIIVEAPLTFQNKTKPLYFAEKIKQGWDVYEAFRHKILHVVVTSRPPQFKYWENEVHFRNAIAREGLNVLAMQSAETAPHDDDMLIITDLDEILHPNIVAILKYYQFKQQLIRARLRWTYYSFVWENTSKKWRMCVAVTYRELKEHNFEANGVRYNCLDQENHMGRVLEFGLNYADRCVHGWHCSSCLPHHKFASKVNSYAHSEHRDTFKRNEARLEDFVREGLWYQSGKREGVYVAPDTMGADDAPLWVQTEGYKKYPFLLPSERPDKKITNVAQLDGGVQEDGERGGRPISMRMREMAGSPVVDAGESVGSAESGIFDGFETMKHCGVGQTAQELERMDDFDSACGYEKNVYPRAARV